ncbi:hypothetical protein Dtox_2547 [Desulfofarcimen acetoxidans DSM 771]|uniref:Uncharacterized protein n=1 Tax=Desulfofarcimen acetoxidans (strain ATCC 49208 / DSM 771 / KCTC 5769 / VKM B-1644 / 5575) TaxID=485916 RepID=C8W0U2_DESAS|nr:hypothetical protein Dtox_2547 [Desulfofarcimen acetoxidans DSM 771]
MSFYNFFKMGLVVSVVMEQKATIIFDNYVYHPYALIM